MQADCLPVNRQGVGDPTLSATPEVIPPREAIDNSAKRGINPQQASNPFRGYYFPRPSVGIS
jgi:hypothetical protein